MDDGFGQGLAFNGVLEDDEVRETLNFCFEPLRSERATDVFSNSGNSMTDGCDAAAWSSGMSGFFFAAHDGVNGCELHVHHPESSTTSLVVDLNGNGESMPGRHLGLNTLHNGAMLVFDADDGTNGRQLWASDGTANGTALLGPVEIVQPVPWAGGLLLRSPSHQLMWTNGTDLRNWLTLPSWNTSLQQSLQDLLADLDHIGEAWLHADEQAMWLSLIHM